MTKKYFNFKFNCFLLQLLNSSELFSKDKQMQFNIYIYIYIIYLHFRVFDRYLPPFGLWFSGQFDVKSGPYVGGVHAPPRSQKRSTWSMHFQQFEDLKFQSFCGGACSQTPLKPIQVSLELAWWIIPILIIRSQFLRYAPPEKPWLQAWKWG